MKPLIEPHIGTPENKPGKYTLRVSEMFYSLQGEGRYIGIPAIFLRLAGCNVGCSFCDTKSIWTKHENYTFDQLAKYFEEPIIGNKCAIELLKERNTHLVITGGSPLLQQDALIDFLDYFMSTYHFIPIIEMENECTIKAKEELLIKVFCWNNSPKLSNSGVRFEDRFKYDALIQMRNTANSWFKFVINSPADIQEIKRTYIAQKIIRQDQVILMPEGATREELNSKRTMVAQWALVNGFMYSDRLQVILWNDKVGT